MRPTATPSTLVVTDEVSALGTMTSRVDPEGARRMMEMLVNLYADRRLAVVREYVSNAVDATRAAGRTEPVQITTPTLLEPNFVVTDRGTGMSAEGVEATFLAFAASTKRDTDELIGGLGIGAKSAWAVAESFLVDTVKDGRRTLVRASRDLSHQVLLAGEPTDLPTGTTISVPVEVGEHTSEWVRIVNEVATAHDPGAVMVDGKAVTSIAAGPSRIGPVLCKQVRGGYGDNVMIRSGGTLFAAVRAVTNRATSVVKLGGFVIELPIGSFDHTPSRESIVATDRTLAAVDAALAQYQAAYDALAQRISTLAATDITAAIKLRQDVVGANAPYTVLPIPVSLRVPANGSWVLGSSRSRGRWTRISDIDSDVITATGWASEYKRTLVVTGVPAGRALRGFATHVKENFSDIRRVVVVPQGDSTVGFEVIDTKNAPTGQTFTFDPDMVPADHRFTFEQWTEATKPQRGTRGATSGYQCALISQDGAKPTTVELTGREIADTGLPVWYVEEETAPSRHSSAGTRASVGVYLGRRKVGPLLAAVPEAVTLAEWREARFAALTANWSDTAALAATLKAGGRYDIERFKLVTRARAAILARGGTPSAILDQIAEVHDALDSVTDEQVAALEAVRGSDAAAKLRSALGHLTGQLIDAYPLMRHYSSYGYGSDRKSYLDYLTHMPARADAA